MIGTSHSDDLGKAACSLRGAIVAGSHQTCLLTYTAGFAGVDDTGSIRIVMRYATDAGVPQFDDPAAPNYTTASASNGARLQLRYDVKGHVRPWDKTIQIKIVQGYLTKGDYVTLTLGDTSQGSPGWRMQTFVEDSFELKVLVDRYATGVFEELYKSPTFSIVAGEPVRMVAVAPSLVPPGKPITVRTRLEDAWGNPVGKPKKFTVAGIREPGCHTIPAEDEAAGLKTETNPIVVRAGDQHGRFWADLHGQSEETIGTNSIDDYFRFARDVAFLDACAHQGNDFQITDAFWKTIQKTTKQYNAPGKFVTFPGWEWSGNTGLGGDRNVLFLKEGGPIHRSSTALVAPEDAQDPCAETVEQLFDQLEACAQDVMLFAHVGGRYADLERHREGLETAVEVHSAWGTFEWMLEDAFRRGYRVAVVANSDGHKGRPGASAPGAATFGSYGGLTCILAEKLDRESVWDAYQKRRVYATTGARIFLDVVANGYVPIGSAFDVYPETVPELQVIVHGTAPLERVEVRNAMRVLKVERPYSEQDVGARVKLLWQGAEVRGRGRQVEWDGMLQVTDNRIVGFEPINFHNREKTCRKRGSQRLEWQSTTTGGVAGVIFELENPDAGDLAVRTLQKSFRIQLSKLDADERRLQLDGVGKRISLCRLPPAGGSRHLAFQFKPKIDDLQPGDNPLYVCVVQEDGHMAWSSPFYCVRR